MPYLIALIFLIFIAISSLILFVGACLIWLLTVLVDPRLRLLHLYACFWASLYVWLMPAWSVSVSGKEHIDKAQTYVVICNHQSLLDILVIFGLFFHFKWVSKAEIFKVPVIGWNMVLNRYVKLVRGDKESVQQMMHDCESHLEAGSSVCMFPEGTRSTTGSLKPFKPGAFILAQKCGLPILPIAIDGTTHALPKNSMKFHGSHDIKVTVLPAIYPSEFNTSDPDILGERIRNQLKQNVSTHQEENDNEASNSI